MMNQTSPHLLIVSRPLTSALSGNIILPAYNTIISSTSLRYHHSHSHSFSSSSYSHSSSSSSLSSPSSLSSHSRAPSPPLLPHLNYSHPFPLSRSFSSVSSNSNDNFSDSGRNHRGGEGGGRMSRGGNNNYSDNRDINENNNNNNNYRGNNGGGNRYEFRGGDGGGGGGGRGRRGGGVMSRGGRGGRGVGGRGGGSRSGRSDQIRGNRSKFRDSDEEEQIEISYLDDMDEGDPKIYNIESEGVEDGYDLINTSKENHERTEAQLKEMLAKWEMAGGEGEELNDLNDPSVFPTFTPADINPDPRTLPPISNADFAVDDDDVGSASLNSGEAKDFFASNEFKEHLLLTMRTEKASEGGFHYTKEALSAPPTEDELVKLKDLFLTIWHNLDTGESYEHEDAATIISGKTKITTNPFELKRRSMTRMKHQYDKLQHEAMAQQAREENMKKHQENERERDMENEIQNTDDNDITAAIAPSSPSSSSSSLSSPPSPSPPPSSPHRMEINIKGDVIHDDSVLPITLPNSTKYHPQSTKDIRDTEYIPPQVNVETGEVKYPFIPSLATPMHYGEASNLHKEVHLTRLTQTIFFLREEKERVQLEEKRKWKDLYSLDFLHKKQPNVKLANSLIGKTKTSKNLPTTLPDVNEKLLTQYHPNMIPLDPSWIDRILNTFRKELSSNNSMSQYEKEKLISVAFDTCRRAYNAMLSDRKKGYYRVSIGPNSVPLSDKQVSEKQRGENKKRMTTWVGMKKEANRAKIAALLKEEKIMEENLNLKGLGQTPS